MPARRDEEVLAVRRAEDRVEALAAVARLERELRPVREHAVHREAAAVEVVARRVEDDEVDAGGGAVGHAVALGVGAPGERVVERVEVGAVRDRRARAVDRAARADGGRGAAARRSGARPSGRSASSARSRASPSPRSTTSSGPCGTVSTSRFTFSPGRNTVETRSGCAKFTYQASRSSVMCATARCVPCAEVAAAR